MFDELMKEATAIPFLSKMRFLTELQKPWGMPLEPVLTVDSAAGLFKVAAILKNADGDEEQATLDLERQAMIDPQVQQALDYQQLKNERDTAQDEARAMNQQLFEAQSGQAMSDQQAQQAGQQVAELEGALQQETAGRQEAQTAMVAAKDTSLQEQMAVQDQKQQMNTAAQTFQEQANMLTQQLKAVAAQPTAAPPAAPPGAPGMGGEMPPPATAGAAQEQQEAANAEQEAAIQGDQAAVATEEDMAMQEQQAMAQEQAAGGMPPEAGGAPPQEAMPPEAMPKQGSDLAAMARILKQAQVSYEVPAGVELDPQRAKQQGNIIGGTLGGLGGAAGGAAIGNRLGGTSGAVLGGLGGAALGALGGIGLGGAAGQAGAKREQARMQSNMSIGNQMQQAAQANKVKWQETPEQKAQAAQQIDQAYQDAAARGLLTSGGRETMALGSRGLGDDYGIVPGVDIRKTGSDIHDSIQKLAFYMEGSGPRIQRTKRLNQPSWARENSYKAKDHFEDFLSLAEQKKGKELTKADVDNLITAYNKATGSKVPKVGDWDYGHVPSEAFDASGGRSIGLAKSAGIPKLDPKTRGAIIGAAIGALGGAAGGAMPGMTTGTTDTPGSRAGGGIRGFGRGALAGAASGAAGGALVGHTLAGGQSEKQLGRLAGGAALILGAPILGGVAGAKGAQSDRGFPKFALSLAGKVMAPIAGAVGGGAAGALAGGAGGALAAEEGARLEALKRGAGVGALTGAVGGGLGGAVFGAGGRPMTGMGIAAASPTVAALAGATAGKGAQPPRTPEDEELRQLLPEEQMPKAAGFKLAIGNVRGR